MHDDLDQRTQCVRDRLRRLPDELQPPFGWQDFKRRSQLHQRPSLSSDWTWKVAAAATVVVAIATAAFTSRLAERATVPMRVPARAAPAYVAAPANGSAPADDAASAEKRSSFDAGSGFGADRSTAIEAWLASLPREPIVVRVGTRAAVAGLEDRIAQVDDILTAVRLDGGEPNRLARLQQERTRLVGSLAQVRYAEVVAAQSP